MEKINGGNNSKKMMNNNNNDKDSLHALYKVPSGDGPYVRAKHAQVFFYILFLFFFFFLIILIFIFIPRFILDIFKDVGANLMSSDII